MAQKLPDTTNQTPNHKGAETVFKVLRGWIERMHVCNIIFIVILPIFSRHQIPAPLFLFFTISLGMGKQLSFSSRVLPSKG
jgi:hypothetical protein